MPKFFSMSEALPAVLYIFSTFLDISIAVLRFIHFLHTLYTSILHIRAILSK